MDTILEPTKAWRGVKAWLGTALCLTVVFTLSAMVGALIVALKW